jgi:hypothetical protein
MLVSYFSEPILAFGAMKQWRERGLLSFIDVTANSVDSRNSERRGLGRELAMILLLKSVDELNAGLGWKPQTSGRARVREPRPFQFVRA